MHFRRTIFFFFILSTSLTLLSLVQAQQPDPLPLPLEPAKAQNRATVELLTNTSFETDADNDKIPDGWVGKKTNLVKKDKYKCNKPEKIVANTGECAFMFKGNVDGSKSKLQQSIPTITSIVDGGTLTLSAFVDPRSAVIGSRIAKAKVKFSDNTKIKLDLLLQESDTYLQLVDSELVVIPEGASITQAKVFFSYGEVSGKYFVDDVSLTITTDDALTETPGETPTDGPSPTASDTPTITPSATASNTPTITPSATASNTPTITPSSTPSNTPGP